MRKPDFSGFSEEDLNEHLHHYKAVRDTTGDEEHREFFRRLVKVVEEELRKPNRNP